MRTNNLSEAMDFDHVVLILPGGVIDTATGLHAPELPYYESDEQIAEEVERTGWTLLSGYTRQMGGGPIMHASELIGGHLAEHILCNPGLYVAMVAECDAEECECGWEDACECASEDECECECSCSTETSAAGWVVAFREHEMPSGAYQCPCCGDDYIGTAYICEECDESGCELTFDGTGEVGFWECNRDDVTGEDDPEDDGRRFNCADCLRTDVRAHERIQTHGGFVCTSCQEREGYADIGNV